MNHVITTYGGGELFFLVFNGIAALFKEDRTGLVIPLIRIGLMVGSLYVVILMLFRNHLMEGLRWLLWVIVATNLLFLPKTRIHIYDPLTNYHRDVDHVPLALGAFASITSQIGRHITEKLESVFTLPDYMPYHKTGTVFASSMMSQLGRFRITDPVFKGNMERFVNQCVVYDAMIGHKYTLSDLYNSPNIWELVTTNASSVLGFLYKEEGTPGAIVPCRVGAQRLNSLWAAEINRAIARYGRRVQNRDLNQTAFNTELLGSMRLLSGAIALADSAQNLLRQEMMIHAVEDGSQNKLSELGSAANYASTKALLQQRSAYAAAGEIAARTLPLFKNVIEALSYALFIFIVGLALMPNGHRVLLTYCGILVWTQLWAPLYAVLNLIMTLYGRAETMAQGAQNGLTFLNSAAIINANADMTPLAAWLSVSIPFISYGILRQGAATFVGMAQHLGSAMQSAASSAASETVSGNISLGNVSLGTQAYQNTSAFQHMTSPSYSTSSFRTLSSSGVETATFAGGSQALTDHAMSHLGIQIMGTENTSYMHQQSLNTAKSLLHSTSVAAHDAQESAFQRMTNFLSQVGETISHGSDFGKTISASDATSLQNFRSYVSDIQQKTGRSYAQAVDIGIAAKLGTPEFLGFGISGQGNFSSQAANHQDIAEAKSIADQQNYTENLERILSAALSYSKTQTGTKLAELGEGATASFNHAKGLLEEVSLAQSQVETLSKERTSSQSQSLTLTKDLTQPLLEFIANQPANTDPMGDIGGETAESAISSGGRIGYERARYILEQEGPERQAYLNRFQEENPQYQIHPISYDQEQVRLSHAYEREVPLLKAALDPSTQHSHNAQAVLSQDSFLKARYEQENDLLSKKKHERQGNRTVLPAPHRSSSSQRTPRPEEEEMSALLRAVDRHLTQRKGNLSHHKDNLHQQHETTKNTTLGGRALKNLGKSLGDGAVSIAEDTEPYLSSYPPFILP